jgi:hypothetical protein
MQTQIGLAAGLFQPGRNALSRRLVEENRCAGVALTHPVALGTKKDAGHRLVLPLT